MNKYRVKTYSVNVDLKEEKPLKESKSQIAAAVGSERFWQKYTIRRAGIFVVYYTVQNREYS